MLFPVMRQLVACPACCRQFDASDRAPGERLVCSCGATVAVSAPRPQDAAVVRCSACGAPRAAQAESCAFCGSDFTLRDRDLDTLCAGCGARVAGKGRFCHHCGTPVLIEQAETGEADVACPACGSGRRLREPSETARTDARLRSRRLGRLPLAVFECGRCAGLWLDRDVFRAVAERARSEELPELPGRLAARPAPRGTESAASHRSDTARKLSRLGPPAATPPQPAVGAPLYRPCVRCGTLMHRRNYGRRSGVILDVCDRHGIWFDHEELDALLRWVRSGGEREAAALREEEERQARRREALDRRGAGQPMPWPSPPPESAGEMAARWLWAVGHFLFETLAR